MATRKVIYVSAPLQSSPTLEAAGGLFQECPRTRSEIGDGRPPLRLVLKHDAAPAWREAWPERL